MAAQYGGYAEALRREIPVVVGDGSPCGRRGTRQDASAMAKAVVAAFASLYPAQVFAEFHFPTGGDLLNQLPFHHMPGVT